MRTLLVLGALALAAVLPAQNFVTNGDFSNGITGWTENGYSVAPGIDVFDTGGIGASQCYGCHPGGAVFAPPHPPNTIEQQVMVLPVPLKLTADIAIVNVNSNGDGGTFWVELGGVEVARVTSGSYTGPNVARMRLCARFTPTTSGMQTLKINFTRRFTTHTGTPRTRIDDISLTIAQGPTFCMQGKRQLGAALTVDVLGYSNAPVAFFLSPLRTGGLQIPGIAGSLYLDPRAMALFFSARLDNNGVYSFGLTIPQDQYLLFAPTWVQGVMVVGGAATLGNEQFLTFTM